jgi:hypothetical protein
METVFLSLACCPHPDHADPAAALRRLMGAW